MHRAAPLALAAATATAAAAALALPACANPNCFLGTCNGTSSDDDCDDNWTPPTEPPIDPNADTRPIVKLDPAPPPITGGTLIVTRSGLAVASDPDRDRIWVVSPDGGFGKPAAFVLSAALPAGSEPWRLVEDAAGRVHVSLRRGGGVVVFDPATGTVSEVRPVCNAPRGLAYDAAIDAVHVACARGELVTLRAEDGTAVRRVWVDEDLRDVVVDGKRLLVSRFRSAEVLALDEDGNVVGRARPPSNVDRAAGVAWKMVPRPTGGAVVLHQEARTDVLPPPEELTYTSGDLVTTLVSIVQPGDTTAPPVVLRAFGPIFAAPLAVDIALAPDASRFAIASPADASTLELDFNLVTLSGSGTPFWSSCQENARCQPVAVAYDAFGRGIAQSREVARVAGVALPAESRWDTGHDLFHTAPPLSGNVIACASCHPEGLEDGRVWRFADGPRRTQMVAGGVLDTAPLHWNGDLVGLGDLMDTVFVGRMGGAAQDEAHLDAAAHWIQSIPRPAVREGLDADEVARGKALFESDEVGCSACHAGPQLTSDASVDVGTGQSFQVPRLVGVVTRAPYMHDGCAKTLRDRFGGCGGGDEHGQTSGLTEAQIDDLVTYLESL